MVENKILEKEIILLENEGGFLNRLRVKKLRKKIIKNRELFIKNLLFNGLVYSSRRYHERVD